MKVSNVCRKPKDDGVCFLGYLFDGRYVWYTLEREGDTNTIATIEIDAYGDQPLSKMLFDRTSSRLATLPQSINPPFAPRSISEAVTHRGQDVDGYRGASRFVGGLGGETKIHCCASSRSSAARACASARSAIAPTR